MPINIASEFSLTPGTFEYIEAKIRCDAEGTTFGGDFEWLCQWFLENAPRYRGQFDKTWRWKDWPDRWGADAGIDIVARTRAGELWAIQAKADHPDRTITKREIDSFLSESNRPQFAYRLLMATTDDIGATARRTLHGQEKPVGLVLRGHFLTEEVQWPVQIGGTAPPLNRWTARPHQATAIKDVVNGFRDQDRGRLIMACGTGKTLTALWIAERLQSSLTLVLVPSLSLVQQNLAEWGRHSAEDFDTLVVCSDESVVQSKADTAIQSTADLGVKVTTDPAEIRKFLGQRRTRPAVVFATYQSSDRIAAAQVGKMKKFDLVICDEAHRLAGSAEGLFATVLNATKIKARKRLFMTATPRYFKEHVKRRAAELESEFFQLVSMDDVHVFGPEFHVLTFHEAISANPPLLTDYQVVVIGVTDREAKAWAEEARLVQTPDGLSTDARTLAAQIGLAKAMKKYNLRKLITFHSSVAKAARFVDPTLQDSLPGVIPHLTRSARPSGKLWTKHISGHTPAGQRATLLKGLGNLPDDTRGILSNCACLGEGVDVPVLDGVAFIDPKRSMVDIIQAVGRVIRLAKGKLKGTIVIPVFIDESEDADHVLSQSAFEPVWQVLKALRAHDRRLADELDQLRLSLGKRSKTGGRINLPANIHLDVPRLLLRDFEQAFYVRTVEQTTDKPKLTIEQILVWADAHKEAMGSWPTTNSGRIIDADETWRGINSILVQGNRGLPRGWTLAKLLANHRGKRNIHDSPDLTVDQILIWADKHKEATGKWPSFLSGKIIGTDESWGGISRALRLALRGLPKGSSLPKLLAQHRGRALLCFRTTLSIGQILDWADAHKAATGKWPTMSDGRIAATNHSWGQIDRALRTGIGIPPIPSSLAKLLSEHRNRRNHAGLPPLTVSQLLNWADEYKARSGEWPTKSSGRIDGTEENWRAVSSALTQGQRGLPKTSLARLLAIHRGARNRRDLPDLSTELLLVWADEHKSRTGRWPIMKSGRVHGTDETWLGIDCSLREGTRGLPGGTSLARFLLQYRQKPHPNDKPPLTIQQILNWADAHKARIGTWPSKASGRIDGTDETWAAVNGALKQAQRGLSPRSTLANLLTEHRAVLNRWQQSQLTEDLILGWADSCKAKTGKWPSVGSGQIQGTPETWKRIQEALQRGFRGLPGSSSLAQLLAARRGARNPNCPPRLSIPQILEWAEHHKANTGNWPTTKSGPIDGTEENWRVVTSALTQGHRGLPKISLAQLLATHLGKPLPAEKSPLTIERILEWADNHKERTGRWPSVTSGSVPSQGETWTGINQALAHAYRGLPGGTSLSELLSEHRRSHLGHVG